MASPVASPDLLPDLIACLKRDLSIRKAVSLDQLWRADKATFVERPKLRLAHYFDLDPDVLIYDRTLGTLGLVHVLAGDGSAEDTVMSLINRATHVRHLLLIDPSRGDKMPFSVELVIVMPDDEATNEACGRALRATASRTQSLQAIGVNVLRAHAKRPTFTRTALRRAFPWLLVATRRWYASDAAAPRRADPKATSAKNGALGSITLQDYRLRGQRTLLLSEAHKIHLIHGRNGSGKSSLVEALEYVLTGAVARLSNTPDYQSVVRNRDASGPATVTLGYRGGGSAGPYTVLERVSPAPLAAGLNAASFRLDQTVMDQLARATPVNRHKTFGEAFFPEAAEAYETFRTATTEAADALNVLPTSLRSTLDAVGVAAPSDPVVALIARLAKLDDSTSSLGSDTIADCLAVPWSVLQVLGAVDPDLTKLLADWDKDPPRLEGLPDRLKNLDDVLVGVRSKVSQALENLDIAERALSDFQSWQPAAGQQVEDFGGTLNAWLERSALADLAERHVQLARILQEARDRAWGIPWNEPVGLFAPDSVAEGDVDLLQRQAETWATERDDYLNRLSRTARTDPAPTVAGARSTPARLTTVQVRSLDAISAWLGEGRGPRRLGQVLSRAVSRGQTGTFAKLSIGTVGWAEPLLSRVRELAAAVRLLNTLPESPAMWSAAERHSQLLTVLKKYRDLQAASVGISETFFNQLASGTGGADQGLVDAINELMALFTPARFGYQDIQLKIEDKPERRMRLVIADDGPDGVRRPESDADLVFNTAELNTFTIALFLLCAWRINNPLRMLVLDDPLQNMDELTVTCVARGIANVVRLWPQDWYLLLLFHGEDELDRFRDEAPGAVYQLPWLTPAGGGTETQTIKYDERRSSTSTDFQNISEVIARRSG